MERAVSDLVLVTKDCETQLRLTLQQVPRHLLRNVVVADIDSRDATTLVARDAGCQIVRGDAWGAACLAATSLLARLPKQPDIVVFARGNGEDDLARLPEIIAPIKIGGAELVLSHAETPESLRERLLYSSLSMLYRHRVLGFPAFFAVRFPALISLGLTEAGSSWNAELQLRALSHGLRTELIPVGSRGANSASRSENLRTSAKILWQGLRNVARR